MKNIKTVEELEKVCNEFLAAITERKNKAVEVRHREDYIFKRYDTYVLKYSKEKEYGFHTDIELLVDTGKTIYVDSVDFMYIMYDNQNDMFFGLTIKIVLQF